MKVLQKIEGTGLRLIYVFRSMPLRLTRLGRHLYSGLTDRGAKGVELPINGVALWWIELMINCLDLLAFAEIYETIMDWLKPQTRPLSAEEISLARSIFGNSIDYQRVRIDETTRLVCKDHHICYVSFYTINSWGEFSPDIFLHEMMHVWQYQQLGGVYIPRALLAQRTAQGYNYGGVEKLMEVIARGGDIHDFNLEQQAEIVADYFCLRTGRTPRWSEPYKTGALEVLYFFVQKLSAK